MRKLLVLLLVLLLAGCANIQSSYPNVEEPIKVKQIDDNGLIAELASESSVIILGYPDSEWTQMMMPVFNEVAIDLETEFYYYNIESARDGETDTYNELYTKIIRFIRESELDELKYDQIYAPTIIVVKDGEIKNIHIGTTEGHYIVDGEIPELSETEKFDIRVKLKQIIQ